MTPDSQRIAIALACGITEIHREASEGRTVEFWMGMKGDNFRSACVPDYPNDLNAMHDAEGALTHEQLLGFDRMLHIEACNGSFQKAIHATAAQRAEAFLKAIGKWTPAYSGSSDPRE